MSRHKLICITGPDGSGKSTLINVLKARLPGSIVVSMWDAIRDPARRNLLPFNNLGEVDVYLSHLHHESRALLLMHCLAEAMAMAKDMNAPFILVDSYWYKYFATEKAHGTSGEYLAKLVSLFETPDFTFYMDAGQDLTYDRKKKFTRYECGFAKEQDEKSFKIFQKRVIEHFQELMHGTTTRTLDPNVPVSENCRIVLKTIIGQTETHELTSPQAPFAPAT